MKNINKKRRLTINDYATGNEANYRIPKRVLSNLEKKNSAVLNAQKSKEKLNQQLSTENDTSLIENNPIIGKPNELEEKSESIANDNQNEKPFLLENSKLLDDEIFDDNQNDNQAIDEGKSNEQENQSISKPIKVLEKPLTIDPDVLLEVKGLTKRYSRKAKPAVNQISFQVRKGEFHAFVGANGAGKTTTIKSIVGAYAKFQGEIKICGIDNRSKLSRIKLGYIPEIARFPSRLSAYKYLNSMAMLNGLDKKEANNFTKNILEKFNMTALQKVSPNNFSSGQKKKILLAQALSNNPDILVMDEPAANLDPRSRIEFFDILKDLQKQGKSIFISSHILSELDIYANAVTILDGGKIVYTGKRREEQFDDNAYAYKLVLKNENDFGNVKRSGLNIVQDKMDKTHYIVSCNDKNLIDDFVGQLFVKQKLSKIEIYYLSIEEMYKKYVIKGSVHTSL